MDELTVITDRERTIITAALSLVLTTYPMLADLIDQSERLNDRDLADIRALREKIGQS